MENERMTASGLAGAVAIAWGCPLEISNGSRSDMRAFLRGFVLALLVVVSLAACNNYSDMFGRIVNHDDDAFARAYFDSVRTGRVDYALSKLSPRTAGIPGARDSVASLTKYLPAGPIDSMHLIGVNRFTTASVDRSNLTYEFHSAAGWGAASVLVVTELGIRYVDGIRANRLERSVEDTNAFTFAGKGVGYYLMIALVIACVGASLTVAVLALLTPMPRRWLWAPLALVGASALAFNWTSGKAGIELLTVQLLGGAAFRAGPAAPWILKASFPIGALLTWRRIQRARHPAPTADGPPTPPPSDVPAQQRA